MRHAGSRRGRWALLLAMVATASSPGCGADAGLGGKPSSGYLGQASVAPECGALNQACLKNGLDAPVALGSELELLVDFKVNGSTGPPFHFEVADASVLGVTASTISATGEGLSGLLVVGQDGAVLDFIHVWVAPADALRLLAYSRQGDVLGPIQSDVTLLVGDEILLSAEPHRQGQPLLGNFTMQRQITGDAIAVVPDAVGGWYRLVARQPGEASVAFSALGLTETVLVEVVP